MVAARLEDELEPAPSRCPVCGTEVPRGVAECSTCRASLARRDVRVPTEPPPGKSFLPEPFVDFHAAGAAPTDVVSRLKALRGALPRTSFHPRQAVSGILDALVSSTTASLALAAGTMLSPSVHAALVAHALQVWIGAFLVLDIILRAALLGFWRWTPGLWCAGLGVKGRGLALLRLAAVTSLGAACLALVGGLPGVMDRPPPQPS